MALYLIAFNDEWVPDLTLEEMRERGTSARAVIDEMTVAGLQRRRSGRIDGRVQRRPEQRLAPIHRRTVRRDQGAPRRFRGRRCARRCRGTVLGRQDRGRGRLAAGGTPLPASHRVAH
jgi:hypothetical protein